MKKKIVSVALLSTLVLTVGCTSSEITDYVENNVEQIATMTETETDTEEVSTEEVEDCFEKIQEADLDTQYVFNFKGKVALGVNFYVESQYTDSSLRIKTPDYKASYLLTMSNKDVEQIKKDYEAQDYGKSTEWVVLTTKKGIRCHTLNMKEKDVNIGIYIATLNDNTTLIFTSCIDDDSADGNIIKLDLLDSMTDLTSIH